MTVGNESCCFEYGEHEYCDDGVKGVVSYFRLFQIVSAVVGIIGNTIVIAVILKRSKNGADVFILSNAVVDFLFNAVQIPLKEYRLRVIHCYSNIPLITFDLIGTDWFLMQSMFLHGAVTVERMRVLYRPLHCLALSTRQAARLVAAISVLTIGVAIFLMSRIWTLEPPLYVIVYMSDGQILQYLMTFTCIKIIIVDIILIVRVAIVCRRKRTLAKATFQRAPRDQMALSIMLAVAAIAAMVYQVPHALLLLERFLFNTQSWSEWQITAFEMIVYYPFEVLAVAKYSVNPLIYLAISRRFRVEVSVLLRMKNSITEPNKRTMTSRQETNINSSVL